MQEKTEWLGSRSQKFRGGLLINRKIIKSNFNILNPSSDFVLKSLDNKSKRHFHQSPSTNDWKQSPVPLKQHSHNKTNSSPSDYFFISKSSPNSIPSRHQINSLVKKERKLLEARLLVLNLNSWEAKTGTCTASPEPGFSSKADRCVAKLSQKMAHKLKF